MRWLTGVVQAAGSWSVDACCAVLGNDCNHNPPYCWDRTSSSDWLFGLWPGPPQRFEPTGTGTDYKRIDAVDADDYQSRWPEWGARGADLNIGRTSGAPGGSYGFCNQGSTYRGRYGEICGGNDNWGATDVEVWYPR